MKKVSTPMHCLRAVAFVTALFIAGCGGGNSDEDSSSALSQEEPSSKVSALHLKKKSSSSSSNPIYAWSELALDTVRSARLSDAQAARLYALVGVAMYDAVNGIDSQRGIQRRHALIDPAGAPKKGDMSAAASAAAHALLTQAHPEYAALYQAQYDADMAAIENGSDKADGVAWGASVGQQVFSVRQNDGSTPNETQAAGSAIGEFRAAWSGVQFRHLVPFAIASAAPYVSPGAPALNSLDYAAAWNEVKILGNASIANPQALETFQFWASGTGTAQPPGEWIKVAIATGNGHALSVPESARLFALLGMALSDAVAPTFLAKFNHRAWRPTTAIREADADGNAATTADPAWAPRAGTVGSSPEHVSGHSSFAGAGTTVLRGFYCNDDIAFSLQSDSAPNGAARSYANFSSAESEAGRSRVLGGVHFEFSNQAGLQTGRGVGHEVLDTALLRVHGQTHQGGCPK